ncbi:MAG: GNAT family N-acetyltransferase [Chloroflexi bacterium]|nr:GNAT family N-acetyltransferase [Chloroflexota bacterium]
MIERITRLTPEFAEAMGRLVPQLSPGLEPPSAAELTAMLSDHRVHLFVARSSDGAIQGAVALVFYRVPTGLRARIEDLVVSQSQRGLGLGKALMLHAMEAAREEQAHLLDLTSNPSRVEANQLYLALGFQRWETNVYRKVLDDRGPRPAGQVPRPPCFLV